MLNFAAAFAWEESGNRGYTHSRFAWLHTTLCEAVWYCESAVIIHFQRVNMVTIVRTLL